MSNQSSAAPAPPPCPLMGSRRVPLTPAADACPMPWANGFMGPTAPRDRRMPLRGSSHARPSQNSLLARVRVSLAEPPGFLESLPGENPGSCPGPRQGTGTGAPGTRPSAPNTPLTLRCPLTPCGQCSWPHTHRSTVTQAASLPPKEIAVGLANRQNGPGAVSVAPTESVLAHQP